MWRLQGKCAVALAKISNWLIIYSQMSDKHTPKERKEEEEKKNSRTTASKIAKTGEDKKKYGRIAINWSAVHYVPSTISVRFSIVLKINFRIEKNWYHFCGTMQQSAARSQLKCGIILSFDVCSLCDWPFCRVSRFFSRTHNETEKIQYLSRQMSESNEKISTEKKRETCYRNDTPRDN